ncbi:hypothetical protein EDB87DRAFT_1791552, partial [Lactarius vividus]
MDIAMPRRARHRGDPEQGEWISLNGLGEEARLETLGRRLEANTGGRAMNNASDGPSLSETQSERKDFDDGANALWSLYDKEAQAHDEALFQGLLADMSGIPTFAGLFAGVLTSFLVDSLKNLQPDPAQQSVYYQQQSVAMLAQISQQIASIAPQVSVPSTPPPPYLDSSSLLPAIVVNSSWLVGLVFSLSAALFATLVQQWVRSYMKVFQRYDHPLKRARFRQFFFDGARTVRGLAFSATWLIRLSLLLFFSGLCTSIVGFNTTIGALMFACTIPPILVFYHVIFTPLLNLQTPDMSLLRPLFFFVRKFRLPYFGFSKRLTSMGMEACQEWLVMEETDRRKDRDVRATRWLINRTAANADMEPLALAIPGSFNTEWGREVWKEVSSQAREAGDTLEPPTGPSPAGSQVSLIPHPPHSLEEATVDTISRCMRYLFETCSNRSHFANEEARRRRMRACVEAAASLVCRIGYRLDRFGDVGKV